MSTLTKRLNFSIHPRNGAIRIPKWSDVNHYETLSQYCADKYVDLSTVTERDFEASVELMRDYGGSDKEVDSYFFWID